MFVPFDEGVARRGPQFAGERRVQLSTHRTVPLFSRLDEGQTFRCRITPLASGCQGVTAIRVGQEFHPVTYRSTRIEQLELNVVAVSPSLQKQEHP